MTTEDMSAVQANGLDVKANHYEASQCECCEDEVVGSPLSTKALMTTLVVLTALGGIAGHAIAGIDYSIRHMGKETRAIVVETENQIQGHAPGPIHTLTIATRFSATKDTF
jgi:hypothetical protein